MSYTVINISTYRCNKKGPPNFTPEVKT